MEDVGIFYDIWSILRPFLYILGSFGIFLRKFGSFFPVLVCCTQKTLAAPNVAAIRVAAICREFLSFSNFFFHRLRIQFHLQQNELFMWMLTCCRTAEARASAESRKLSIVARQCFTDILPCWRVV
jgi:hypothetical protein